MKPRIKNLFPCLGVAATRNWVLPALMASFGLMLAGQVTAQTFTTLHSFTTTFGFPSTNSDGAQPSGFILSGNTLYGQANSGGSGGSGTVFKINTDGSGFTNLHNFSSLDTLTHSTNSDGSSPGFITLSGSTLFGWAHGGGSGGNGTVFRVNTDGTGFTNLHSFAKGSGSYPNFTNSDGASLSGLMILTGNSLYGAASSGGTGGRGTLFKVNTDGSGFTNLHTFTAGSGSYPNIVNSDGATPDGVIILSGNSLYGIASFGGSGGNGALFAINTNGTGFTNLHNFASGSGSFPNVINSDGAVPVGFNLSGNTLYGMTQYGGSGGNGTLFAINTNGTGFTNQHSFASGTGSSSNITNSDGARPNGYSLSGNTLYGTASAGGSGGNGTLFAINTDGTGFTNLHSFAGGSGSYPDIVNSDGARPIGYVLSGNTLYGTTDTGGSGGSGTAFAVNTNGTGFTNLYSFTALDPFAYTNNDGAQPSGFIFAGNTLYGSAKAGGRGGNGTLFSLYVGPIIQFTANGGFETGDFTGWTLSGDTSYTFVDDGTESGITPHSGSLEAALGTDGSLGYLSQTIPTTAGASYLLSFWLDNPYADPGRFLVSWNGNTLLDEANPDASNWTNIQFTVTATGTSTVLQFGFQDDYDYFGLDNISVISVVVSVTGSLQVNLAPPGAVSAGAQWQVDGGAWQTSGAAVSGLSAGSHAIAFNSITGWITPTNQTATIIASQTTTNTGTFVADVTKPTINITSPTSGQHMTNALANLVGTASDNWKVAGVWYQLNSNAWNLVTTTNNYTNWTQTVTLLLGTNIVNAYALDLAGNYSATNSVSMVSSNTFKLQLAFTNSLPLKTNGLAFTLQLSTGLNGFIQVSTNLTSWATLTNFVGTNATLNFRDPAATNSSRRFYRAVIP